MDAQTVDVLSAGAFALAGTFLGFWLNGRTAIRVSKLEQRRYTVERLWDARKSAYSEILAKLSEARENADRVNQRFNDDELGPHGYFGTEAFREETAATHRAWNACYSMFSSSELILSEAFAKTFREIVSCIASIDPYMDPPEIAWQQAECFTKAHSELMSLAKEELQPPNGDE